MNQLNYCFVSHAIRYHQEEDLMTIFTTSYKSKDYILRPFNSLKNQTYKNWEWIIFDDTDGLENFSELQHIKEQDNRIRIYKSEKNSGIIGNVKNIASSLARGKYLIELDHDDELTPEAVQRVYEAFEENPEVGFAYSDFSEIFEDGKNFAYGEHFSLGYGAYRKEYYKNEWRNVVCCPSINAITIRYLVSCPNHLRAWRKSTFQEIGGWNHHFHVADDFEIMIRTFLKTKMIRIPYLCYIQYRNKGGNNFTFIRNKEIQKLFHVISQYYNNQIHDRLLEINKEDPYHHNWSDWKQFSKSWLNTKYEKPLNLISHHNQDLISIIIILNQHQSSNLKCVVNNEISLILAINLALKQSYQSKEIIVISLKSTSIDEIMNKYHEPMIKYWNLQETDERHALNYACKMVIMGHYVAYWNDKEREEDYMDELLKTINLDVLNDKIHKVDIFKRTGYWKNDKN